MKKPLAALPPMGWNSWNTFSWNINEELIKTTADFFVESGIPVIPITNISLEGLVYHVANLAGLYLSYFITAITEIL